MPEGTNNTAPRSTLRVLMFTDLVDSTGLKSQLKTAGYLPLLRRHDELLHAAVISNAGQLQQDTGDGCFAFFTAASDAVNAALLFQWQMSTEPWPAGQQLKARVGIHTGEVAETEARQDGGQKLVGMAIDLAARVMSLAQGGQILLTRGAFDDARQFITAHPGSPLWLLEKKLGEGGFGEVWLARHAKIKDRVRVFKFCFDPDRLRALKREVVLFRLLKEALGDRRDIARVLEWQFDQSPYFIEMEYTPEGNLSDWAAAQGGIDKVPLNDRLRIVAEVAKALSAAHSVGILHKDIKPSNVLMVKSADGSYFPRLTDFGIGILTDRDRLKDFNITAAGFTASNLTINDSSRTGTRMYSPPEGLQDKPHTVQGDVYALGVVLYQMAVGDLARPLGVGWEREVDDELLREDIAAAVEGQPARRLPSGVELADRLNSIPERRAERRRVLELEAADVRAKDLERRAKRRRRLMIFNGFLAVVLAIAATAFALLLKDAKAKRREADAARQRADANFSLARRAIQAELGTSELLNPSADNTTSPDRGDTSHTAYVDLYRKAYEADPHDRDLLGEYVAVLALTSRTQSDAERADTEGKLDLAVKLLDAEASRRTLTPNERFLIAQLLAQRADVNDHHEAGRNPRSPATKPISSPNAAAERSLSMASELAKEFPENARYAFFVLNRTATNARDPRYFPSGYRGPRYSVDDASAGDDPKRALRLLEGVLRKDPTNTNALRIAFESHAKLIELAPVVSEANEHRREAIRLYAAYIRGGQQGRETPGFFPLRESSALLRLSDNVEADVTTLSDLVSAVEAHGGPGFRAEEPFFQDDDDVRFRGFDDVDPSVLRAKIAYHLLSHGRYDAARDFALKRLSNLRTRQASSFSQRAAELEEDYLRLTAGIASTRLNRNADACSALEPLFVSDALPAFDSNMSNGYQLSRQRSVPSFTAENLNELAAAALDEAYIVSGRIEDARTNADTLLAKVEAHKRGRGGWEVPYLSLKAFIACRVAVIEAAAGRPDELARANAEFSALCRQLAEAEPTELYSFAQVLSFASGISQSDTRRQIFAHAAMTALALYAPIGVVDSQTARAEPNFRTLRGVDAFVNLLPAFDRSRAEFDGMFSWMPVNVTDRRRLIHAAATDNTLTVWGRVAYARHSPGGTAWVEFTGVETPAGLFYAPPSGEDIRLLVGRNVAWRATVTHDNFGNKRGFTFHSEDRYPLATGFPTTNPSKRLLPPIDPRMVTVKDVGQWVWAEGSIARVTEQEQEINLSFANTRFSVVVPIAQRPALQRQFGGTLSTSLLRAKIKVWGVIEFLNDTPQLFVAIPGDLQITTNPAATSRSTTGDVTDSKGSPEALSGPVDPEEENLDKLNREAYLLRRSGRTEEASALRAKVVEQAKTLWKRGDVRILRYQDNYANLLIASKKYDEAAAILLEGLASARDVTHDRDWQTKMLESLISLYVETGQVDKAAEYEKQLRNLVISATDHPALKSNLSQDVVVEGTVFSSKWSKSKAVLNVTFGTDSDGDLLVAIFKADRDNLDVAFGGDIANALRGKTLRVTGQLEPYGGLTERWIGRPQIIIKSPSQIQIITSPAVDIEHRQPPATAPTTQPAP